MTPITVYKEDIENACRYLNDSTVMGVRRAHNILVNILIIAEGRQEENNTKEQINNQQAILRVLDILRYHGMRCDSMLLKDAERLKAELVGEV
jgi:hypothetical protein